MRVEAFAIGFGKAIYSWERKGVKWQICILPFGGYVKIAGMQKENGIDPYQISDGFFGKKPFDRIKVAIIGPIVNIVFALIAFAIIWLTGGREKNFGEYTHKIGWVEENSPLYEFGVRPGDEISTYDSKGFKSFKDILIASISSEEKTKISGFKVDYIKNKRVPFSYSLPNYEDFSSPVRGKTIGLASPGAYLIYDRFQGQAENPLPFWSPLQESGIEYGDRIFWADGEIVFSLAHLKSLISSSNAFLTVERDGEIFHSKVPRVQISDLKLNALEKEELNDWQHEIKLKGKTQDLYFLPYLLSSENVVEKRLDFIDEEMQRKTFLSCSRCAFFHPLKSGDRILAIDGQPSQNSYELLLNLQTKNSLIIVQRNPEFLHPISYKDEDNNFDEMLHLFDLKKIVQSIGTSNSFHNVNDLVLLKPIVPVSFENLPDSQQKEFIQKRIEERKKELSQIQDEEVKKQALKSLQKELGQDYLGITLQDRHVKYNPNPLEEFSNIFSETGRTLVSLFSGYLSPKWLSGPVGIVHAVQRSWFFGAKEALFWMAVVSLNLGFLNLLPIPVLDGGHILFSLFEMCTRKKIKIRTMERLVFPFVLLIIGFFVYVTYHDLARLFKGFF